MNHSHASPSLPPVQESIIALLRSAIWGHEAFVPQPDTDWDSLYTELCHQTIQHLPSDLLPLADPEHTMVYLQNAAMNIRKWHLIMDQQQKIISMLAQEGIPCVVLKGAAAAQYYPKPELRCMGDIDLIVRPEDFDRALALFQDPWKIISEGSRHVKIRNKHILVELHRKFSTFRSDALCNYLDNLIYNGIANPQVRTLGEFSYCCLPETINGLVLLTHINSHMEQGLGLRQLLDWMLYVDRQLDDQHWQAGFAEAVHHLGLETLAITVTRMCQIYLGLREDITWCQNANPELCRDLLEHTFDQGNFGRKHPWKIGIAVGVVSTTKNLPAFFREMQRRGMNNWKAAQTHRIFRPFAWLYQIFRYIRLGLMQPEPIRYLFQAISSEKSRGALLDRLDVSRVNNDK